MIVKLMTWWRGEQEQNDFFHVRCLHCEQKIRYRREKGGSISLCPRCRRSVKLPAEEVSLKTVHSAKVGRRLAQRTDNN
jgi:NAD-dependent SIR2 family protein deacetylase